MTCPICNNEAPPRLKKGHTQYYQCSNCKTVFSQALDNDNMVGGGNELQRNQIQNHERIKRIDEIIRGIKMEDVHILDFGCGHGYLVADLKDAGFTNTVGYDCYNPEFSTLPEKNKFHVVTCIEVIEHTSSPFVEIDVICRSLVRGGVLMVETSFVDVADQEGIELEEFDYLEPKVGHSTLFSFHGLDLLMSQKGLTVRQAYNRHVHLYQKK